MAHDHTFDCRICGAHLDSQEDLNKHNRECHTAQANTADQSSKRQGSSGSSGQPNDTTRNF